MSVNAASNAKAVRWWAALATALTIAFSAHSASALSVPGTVDCKYDRQIADYFPDSPDQENQRIDSIHICSYSYDGHREAELVLPPQKDPTGVCVVRSVQYYLPPSGQMKSNQSPPAGWESSHPHDWWNPLTDMQIAAGECPRPGDVNYIRTIGVPPGAFLELAKFWAALIANPKKIEENFTLVPDEKTGPVVTEIKALLTDPALLAKIHLQQVSLENQTGEKSRGVPAFLLSFPSPRDRDAYYSLCLDWIDGKLKIIGVTLEIS